MQAFRATHTSYACNKQLSSCSRRTMCLIDTPQRCQGQFLATGCRRTLTVAVFSKKDHKESKDCLSHDHYNPSVSELQAYIKREEYLLAELSAARNQIDKLLDQQHVLLGMVARLSGLAGAPYAQSGSTTVGHVGPPAPPPLPSTAASSHLAPPVLPDSHRSVWAPLAAGAAGAAPPGTAVQPPPKPTLHTAAASISRGSGSGTSKASNDVPAPTSLAELLRAAAASSSSPHPASAAAAASVAAAIDAVDSGADILEVEDVLAVVGGGRQHPRSPPGVPPQSAEAIIEDVSARRTDPEPGSPETGVTSTAVSPQSPPPPPPPSLPSASLPTAVGVPAAGGGAGPAPGGDDDSDSDSAGGDSPLPPVETPKADPRAAPPELVLGDDDIHWVARLHVELEGRGFYPGDDDVENWVFGETTLAAVLSFQASHRLPETGVVDRPTWTELLGADVAEELYGRAAAGGAAAAAGGAAETGQAEASASASDSSSSEAVGLPDQALTKWPVLMDGEGGREVHHLQVALANAGFHCGSDDMRWWQFGEGTLTALKFFQSCNGVPESGVCDERTWRTLLGPASQPADLYSVRLVAVDNNSDDEDGGYEEDMEGASQGRVWLLGEQRWERRSSSSS